MSAPEVTVFLPKAHDYGRLLENIASKLCLNIEAPPYESVFAFSAQRVGADHFLIQYDADSIDITDEIRQWEKPSQEYKSLIQGCSSCVNIHYRNINMAKQCLIMMSNYLGQNSLCSVVENGYGCLLRLSDIVEHIAADPTWSWERETFPNLPGVADSEWID